MISEVNCFFAVLKFQFWLAPAGPAINDEVESVAVTSVRPACGRSAELRVICADALVAIITTKARAHT